MELPWSVDEEEPNCPPERATGVRSDAIGIERSRDGWVTVWVGASYCFLSPERAREAIAAIEAAISPV